MPQFWQLKRDRGTPPHIFTAPSLNRGGNKCPRWCYNPYMFILGTLSHLGSLLGCGTKIQPSMVFGEHNKTPYQNNSNVYNLPRVEIVLEQHS